MQLDPTAWAIAFVGFVYDWLMTRNWKQVLIGLIPTCFLVLVAVLVVRGHTLDKNDLAQWYLELGEKEIEDWDDQWAPSRDSAAEQSKSDATKEAKPENKGAEKSDAGKSEEKGANDSSSTAGEAEEKTISPYAMALFRRVQQLQVNNPRSRFIVAMVLAQRGSFSQAKALLAPIASDNSDGYPPAHAWLAQFHSRKGIDNADDVSLVRHHLLAAEKGERVPMNTLLLGGQFFRLIKDLKLSMRFWQRAAEFERQYLLQVAELANVIGNTRLAESAINEATVYFDNKVKQNARDNVSRILLAECLVRQRKLDEAEKILVEGRTIKDDPQLKRLHSQVYVVRFELSLSTLDGKVNANLPALNQALQIDQTNPMIFERVAHLASLGGAQPSAKLMEELRTFLAEGRATATTHLWIAQLHLAAIQRAEADGLSANDPKVADDYKEAVFHLEQVANRMPEAADCLNNLAYVLTKSAPNRLNDALKFASQATQIAQPPRAEFFDTLGMVYMAMSDSQKAITAYERAIELKPSSADFHRGAAAAYEKSGNQGMAEIHRQKAALIEKANAANPPIDSTSATGTPSTSEQPVNKSAEPTTTDQQSVRPEPTGGPATPEKSPTTTPKQNTKAQKN